MMLSDDARVILVRGKSNSIDVEGEVEFVETVDFTGA
jgi:hypothetical protein